MHLHTLTKMHTHANSTQFTSKHTLTHAHTNQQTSSFPSNGGASLELIHRGVTGSSPRWGRVSKRVGEWAKEEGREEDRHLLAPNPTTHAMSLCLPLPSPRFYLHHSPAAIICLLIQTHMHSHATMHACTHTHIHTHTQHVAQIQ